MRHPKNFLGKQITTSSSQTKFTNTEHVYANFQQNSFRDKQVKASFFWTLFLLHPVGGDWRRNLFYEFFCGAEVHTYRKKSSLWT